MKNIKSNIMSFILGAIMFSGVTVFASTLLSKDITFKPTKDDWQVTTVEEAINDLYDYSREDTINKLDFTTTTSESYGNSISDRSSTLTVEPGNYIIVSNIANVSTQNTVINKVSSGNPKLTYTTGECKNLKNKVSFGSASEKFSTIYLNTLLVEGIWKCSFAETSTLSFSEQYLSDYTKVGQVVSAYAIKLN